MQCTKNRCAKRARVCGALLLRTRTSAKTFLVWQGKRGPGRSGRPKRSLLSMDSKRGSWIHDDPDTRTRPCGVGDLCDKHCGTRGIRAQVLGKCSEMCKMCAPPQAAREKWRSRALGSEKSHFVGVLGADFSDSVSGSGLRLGCKNRLSLFPLNHFSP